MLTRFTAVLLASAATFASLPSVAQSRSCIGGDLDHLSPAERQSCSAMAQAVRNEAAALHAPANWHFVVVCGEDGWKSYAAFSTRPEGTLEAASVDTDLLQQTTYLRQSRLQAPQIHGLRQVVAHEVAAIVLHTEDETAIAAQLASWEHKGNVREALLTQ